MIKRHEFPENSSLVSLLKPLAEGAMKSAQKLPEKWWPKYMNGYPVDNLSEDTVILVLEDNAKRKVEFFAGYKFEYPAQRKFVYDVVETIYEKSAYPIDGGFYLLLP